MNALVIALLATLIPFNGLALWAFLHFGPKGDSPFRRQIFNAATFAIVPVVCAVFSLWLSSELGSQVEEYWRPVLTALGWVAAFPTLLFVAGAVRYYLWLRREDSMIEPKS